MINALLLAANKLKQVDILFFVLCGVAVLVGVAIYFLIPVFNKKQYQEQRDNLRKREEAFKANKKESLSADDTATENDGAATEEVVDGEGTTQCEDVCETASDVSEEEITENSQDELPQATADEVVENIDGANEQ